MSSFTRSEITIELGLPAKSWDNDIPCAALRWSQNGDRSYSCICHLWQCQRRMLSKHPADWWFQVGLLQVGIRVAKVVLQRCQPKRIPPVIEHNTTWRSDRSRIDFLNFAIRCVSSWCKVVIWIYGIFTVCIAICCGASYVLCRWMAYMQWSIPQTETWSLSQEPTDSGQTHFRHSSYLHEHQMYKQPKKNNLHICKVDANVHMMIEQNCPQFSSPQLQENQTLQSCSALPCSQRTSAGQKEKGI